MIPPALDVLTLLKPTRHAVRLDAAGATAATAASGTTAGVGLAATRLAPPLVDVPEGGLEFPFDWGPATPGVDRAELAPVAVEVWADRAPDFGGYPLGELGARVEGTQLIVTAPAGRLIRALALTGLRAGLTGLLSGPNWPELTRLAVSLPDPRGGWAAPIVSVPPVAGYGAVPATLTGASFARGVLRLPDLPGPLRVTVVTGERPDTFAEQPLSVGRVFGWAAPTPVDLTLTGPDGAALWRFAGAMPGGAAQSADITVPVAGAVETLRAAGGPIAGSLRLTGKFPCKVRFRVGPVRGDLIRNLTGSTTVELAGEPVALPLATPLPPAAPSAVVADVEVRHGGRRLADLSDPLPAAGSQRGVVVRQNRVLRVLPPLALRGERVSRIGLVGHCPEPTALLVRLVPAATTPESAPAVAAMGTPGTANVEATTTVGVVWVDLPEPVCVDQPVAIEVSAGAGALYWVTGPEPLVRVVVLDPDPGGRPVALGGATLLSVDQPVVGRVRAALPAASFAGGAPLLASALFCSVEITDAELRYPRGA